MQHLVVVESIFQSADTMRSLIRCLQFGSNEVLRRQQIPREIVELLLMAAGCLLNATQKSVGISTVFRDNEGIMTIVSLLKNEVLFPRSAFAASTDRSLSASFVTDGTCSSLASPCESNPLCVVTHHDPSVKKLQVYLAGTLMNLSNVDEKNCAEIVALDGVETLMGMMQLSTDRFNTYCLECVKTCCRGLANSSVSSVVCGDD